IEFMIIGYDFDFSNEMRLEVHCQDHQKSGDLSRKFDFDFNSNSFLMGIPVLNELNNSDKSILIGHYFLKKENTIKKNTIEANVFSYSLNKSEYVELPSFRFQVLTISGFTKTYGTIPFKGRLMRFMRRGRY